MTSPLRQLTEPGPSVPTTRPGRSALVGALLLAIGTVLGLYLTATGARATGELRLDEFIGAHRAAPLVALANVVNVGLGPALAPFLLLTLCLLLARQNRWAGLVFAASAMVGWFSVALGKITIGRHRPPGGDVHALVRETGLDSYPSGHTALAAAIVAGLVMALTVSGRSTRWAWVLGVPFVVLVAASRLYLGAHYLGDVVGAMIYVTGSVLIFSALLAVAVSRWGRANPERRALLHSAQHRRA